MTARRPLFVLAVVVLCACPGGRRGPDEADAGPSIPPVEVEAVVQDSVTLAVEGTATLRAERDLVVHAGVDGTLRSLPVEEGARVEKGQRLATIENDRLQIALEGARASLARLESELARLTGLQAKSVVSQGQVDEARYQRDTAALEVRRLESQVAELVVRAPFSGVVAERQVEAGSRVTPGMPLFRLVDRSRLLVDLRLPEQRLPQLEVGQPARVRAAVRDGTPVPARVMRIAPVVDPRSGTVKVTVEVDPERAGHDGLLPGLLAEVEVLTGTRAAALLVPRRAVGFDTGAAAVWRVQDGRAEEVRVVLGLRDGDRVEITGATPALAPGDLLVTLGRGALRPGIEVRVVGEDAGGGAP